MMNENMFKNKVTLLFFDKHTVQTGWLTIFEHYSSEVGGNRMEWKEMQADENKT